MKWFLQAKTNWEFQYEISPLIEFQKINLKMIKVMAFLLINFRQLLQFDSINSEFLLKIIIHFQ